MKHRNVGIIGASDSGAKEVFDAILRHSYKRDEYKGYAVMDNADTVDLGEYGSFEEEVKPPYDAKKRKRLFEDKSE